MCTIVCLLSPLGSLQEPASIVSIGLQAAPITEPGFRGPLLALASVSSPAPNKALAVAVVHGQPASISVYESSLEAVEWRNTRRMELASDLGDVRWLSSAGDADSDGVQDFYVGSKRRECTAGVSMLLLVSGASGKALRKLVVADEGDCVVNIIPIGKASVGVLSRRLILNGGPQARRMELSVFSSGTSTLMRLFDAIPDSATHDGCWLVGDLDGDMAPEIVYNASRAAATDSEAPSFECYGTAGAKVLREFRQTRGTCAGTRTSLGPVPCALDDLNMDGVDEYAFRSPGPLGTGCADVFHGVSGELMCTIRSPASEDLSPGFPACLEGITDIDGDGSGEIVISNPSEVSDKGVVGAVFVYSSKSGSLLGSVLGDRDMMDLGRLLVVLRDPGGVKLPLVAVTAGQGVRIVRVVKPR